LISGIGVNNVWSIYDKLKEANIIQVSGRWAAINIDGEVIKFQNWQGLQAKCSEDDSLFGRLVSVYQSLP